jgi:hypothetical protein
MKRKLLLALFFVLAGHLYAAEGVVIRNGFGTGEDFLNMNSAEQRAYAMGVIIGMLLAPLFGASKSNMLWIEQCVERMTDSQAAAILNKYLRNNPGRWHETPHAPMYSAMLASCPR